MEIDGKREGGKEVLGKVIGREVRDMVMNIVICYSA